MNDLEMTKKCAEMMGLAYTDFHFPKVILTKENAGEHYDPRHDDAQMVALARKFPYEFEQSVIEWCNHLRRGESYNLNYEFCKRIAEKA